MNLFRNRWLWLCFSLGTGMGIGSPLSPEEVAYGPDPLQKMDISRAQGRSGPVPVVVFVHGGGWSFGDKAQDGSKSAYFTREGYVYVTINYRLSPAVQHPAHVSDVAAAVGWLHQHVGIYGGDPSRIFLMGHSAGAHLVSLVATDPRYLAAHQLHPSDLAGVISLDSASYLLNERAGKTDSRAGGMIEKAFGKDPAVWKEASPLTWVRAGALFPPFLIVYVSRRQDARGSSEKMTSALASAGMEAVLYPAENKTHMTLNRQLGQAGDLPTLKVLEFLQSHGAPKGKPGS